jgi:sulfopyruvate decarboxylase subunit alpha
VPQRDGTPIQAAHFWDALKARGITFFSGVPDSTFQSVYGHLLQDPDIRYVPAVREDQALGIASAAYFHGKLGGVLMQNSGIGNIVNPLTSFNLMYRIPALLVVGWRGYGGPPNDAPEHWIMGAKTPAILDLMELPWVELERHNLEEALEELLARIQERETPGALLVPPGVIQ